MTLMRSRRRPRGFTLIEMLVNEKPEETPFVNGTDLPLVITAVTETPKNKGKVEPVFEVSLPAPDEIPELNTYRDSVLPVNNGLDFAIEDTRAREAAGIDRPPVVPLNGDNIHQVEEDMFEKIVPDGSLETLDPDEEVGDWTAYDPTLELSTYQYPTIDLLEQRDGNQSREVNRGELEENKNKIVQTLQNYKIDITSIKATIGNVSICKLKVAAWASHARSATATMSQCLASAFVFPEPAFQWNPAAFLI